MKNIQQTLNQLGLSNTESEIYVYLLKSGPSLGRQLSEDLNLEKTQTYDAINSLTLKSLLYSVGKQRYQKFVAVPPEKLLEIIEEKKATLQKATLDIESMMDSLTEYATEMYSKKNIRIIEGEKGFERWMDARLEAASGSYIREISSNKQQESFIKDIKKFKALSYAFPKERILKGIHMKALMRKEDIYGYPFLESVEKTDPEMLKEVRLLPDTFVIEAGFQTYNNKVSFMREYQGNFLGVIIEDKFITNLVNNMFDFIFEQSEII